MNSHQKLVSWVRAKNLAPAQLAAFVTELERLKKAKASTYTHFGIEGCVFAAHKHYNYQNVVFMAMVKFDTKNPTDEQVKASYDISISLDCVFGVDDQLNFDLHRDELPKVINELRT